MNNSDNVITPDENGRFGDFGGRYVAETLMPPILALEAAYSDAKTDPSFLSELDSFFNHYVGRLHRFTMLNGSPNLQMVLKFILKETN